MQDLLAKGMQCRECMSQMAERLREDCIDKVCWQCRTVSCPKYKTTVTIKAGSFFENYRIKLSDIWCIVAMWMTEQQICKTTEILGISKKIVIKVYSQMREKVKMHLESTPIRLGGYGVICQIDETLILQRPKHNRGRSGVQQWAFGVVDTSFAPAKGIVFLVPDRKAQTLLPLISSVCLSGTVIYSDEWAAYRNIQSRLGFNHLTVNHSENFVNPADQTHTQHVEAFWSRIKKQIKYMGGVRRDNMQGWLDDFAWRDYYRERLLQMVIGLLRIN